MTIPTGNKNKYLIRDGKGGTKEVDFRTVAFLIDAGKAKYTGKKSKWNKQEARMVMNRFYIKIDQPSVEHVSCDKPCCVYIRE